MIQLKFETLKLFNHNFFISHVEVVLFNWIRLLKTAKNSLNI